MNLDEEELIVMESCHSYIHDMLRYGDWRLPPALSALGYVPLFRHLGPTHATDPILLHEINKFPDEAKVEHLETSLRTVEN